MELIKSAFLVLVLYGFYASAQKTNFKCDFENGLCSFLMNDRNNRENWKIGRGKLNAHDTGPSVDHTLGNANGSYLFVNATAAKTYEVNLQTSILRNNYCIRFFYNMYGAAIGDLSVRTVNMNRPTDVVEYFKHSKSQGDRWKEAAFLVTMTNEMKLKGYRIVFSAQNRISSNISGHIALDDMELTPEKCPDTRNEAERICSFDYYNCGYTVSRHQVLNWDWRAIGKSSVDLESKPKGDHTLGTNKGGYWFAGTTTTRGLERVTLKSPRYNKPRETLNCLHFYYFIESRNTGSWWNPHEFFKTTKQAYIQAYISYNDYGGSVVAEKKINATIQKEWRYVEAKVNITKDNYQFEFIAGIESTREVTIALDDIWLSSGNCPDAGFCDFEQDKCSWTDGKGHFTWLRKSGNSSIGPPGDNTLKTIDGHYLVINIQGKKPGTVANLESELFPPSKDPICFSFYFFQSGENVGTLKVLRLEENITVSVLWAMKNSPLPGWRKAMVELQSTFLYSKVVLKGIIGHGKNGFIALDDVRFRKGEKCDLTPPEADPKYEITTVEPPVTATTTEMPNVESTEMRKRCRKKI